MFSFISNGASEGIKQDEETATYAITNRHIITAPEGKVLAAIDFKNQE